MAKKILLADDHKILRDGLKSLIESQMGFTVVAEADNGRDACRLAKKLKPDIVIMDLTMPDMNGIEATREIVTDVPKTRIIALSMHSDKRFVSDMLNAGASAYLLKDCAFEELERAINAVMSNQTYVSPTIAGVLVQDYLDALHGKNEDDLGLSSKEKEVLILIAEGMSTKEIAWRIGISSKTAESHRYNIMAKLKLHTVADLTKFAVRKGWVNL